MKPTRDLDELFARMAQKKRHTKHWEMRLRGMSLPQLRREANVREIIEVEWREETVIKPVVKKKRIVKQSVRETKLKPVFTNRQIEIAMAAIEREKNG